MARSILSAQLAICVCVVGAGLAGLERAAAAREDGGQLAGRKVIREPSLLNKTKQHKPGKSLKLLEPTSYGYLDVNPEKGSEMFYMYYEATEAPENEEDTPIVLWLQGGPGCSSFFGMLYINGPYFVNDDLTLRRNLGSWNRLYGMLFIEQPIGVGFSRKGRAAIPDNELDVAWDLYRALQSFFRTNPGLRDRPLIITGEG
ncbi:hypothetical protein GPECTOR_5g155 [Gonium pectorale]|uniref:Uncharacterized protein n=1 Tax=Gonium pectorale TaxID=33097 RepID=A0A150GVY8_GONPE|nr:hypothetical protein GPECTOR_5g155 [Gonium pectorale]|eukprot:KXZ54046.1 hypothetical protein GPECTOR_5g155 [Gonium pectorale]